MTIDPNGIGNELHNCPRNKGAIAVRLRLNPALSPPFYEHRNSEAGAYIPIVMSEPIALDPNCVSLKPNDWRFLDMRGHILLALGDTNVALEDLSLSCGSN
ncbi:MAG: hypothetical protein WA579_03410, partial [Rhodomicrobium sp.]